MRRSVASIISIISILFLIQFIGCSNNATGPNTTLYKKLWDRASSPQYVIEQTLQCFCPNSGRPTKLIIYGDQIGYALFTDTNEEIPENQLGSYKSVDDLFEYIDELKRRNPYKLEIEFDPDFGYPSRIYVDQEELMVDEEMVIITTVYQLGED